LDARRSWKKLDHVIFHPLLAGVLVYRQADTTVARVSAHCIAVELCAARARWRGPGEVGWIRPVFHAVEWRRWPPEPHDDTTNCQRDAVVRANYLLLPLFAAAANAHSS